MSNEKADVISKLHADQSKTRRIATRALIGLGTTFEIGALTHELYDIQQGAFANTLAIGGAACYGFALGNHVISHRFESWLLHAELSEREKDPE